MDGHLDNWLQMLPEAAERHARRVGRPLVTVSYAQSLDGSLAARRGTPLALSGPESMRVTHRLRAVHQAILVGIGTVLADNPKLTVRLVSGENPRPVVLDSRLRLPLDSHLLQREENFPWVFTAETDNIKVAERRSLLEKAGAQVFEVSEDALGGLDLNAMLMTLAAQGITSLMVEGGARVITKFFERQLGDYAVVTVAPIWVGGLRAVDAPLEGYGSYPFIEEPGYLNCGRDWIVWGRISGGGRG